MNDCEGLLTSINTESVKVPAMFVGLKQFMNPERPQNKLILVVLKDGQEQEAVDIIHEVAGDLKLPNTGVLFCLAVTRWEGVK